MEYYPAAQKGQIPPGTLQGFSVAGKEILVVNVNGTFYAVGKKCPHLWGDLSKGKVEGKVVICPRHHSQFDVTNGKRLAGPAKKDLLVYPVKTEGESVLVGI
jgi:3-phenylpropionate/trans-cinnamate dioxygenase ferredoxin component